jgi:hypothetical protein
MPAGAVIAAAITAGAGTATAVHGRRAQTRAGRQAAKYTEAAASQATRIEQDAETRRREEYERETAEEQRRHEAEQAQLMEDRRLAQEDRLRAQRLEEEDRRLRDEDRRIAEEERQRNIAIWNEREARLAPYRQAGAGALSELQRLAGQSGGAAPSAGPRPMPEGWTPDASAQTSAAPPVSDLPTTASRASLESYTSSLPVTRDRSLAQEMGEPEPPMDEPMSGALSQMRQPAEDVNYLLDNPSTMSPEAYRRLVQAQGGEGDPDAMPLSMMRQPVWANRRRPYRRSEARA